MALAKPKSSKRILKIFLIIVGVFAFSFLALHLWFVYNARDVLKQVVANESGGKLKLKLSEFSFGLLSNNIKIREADLVNTDTASQPVTYHIKFRKLTLRVASFWPLLLQRRLLLDSIKLHDPEVEVLQWRKVSTTSVDGDELSIPQEMGKLYNYMLDALDDLGVRRIIINNAKVSLINKTRPLSEPVTVSKIYLDLVRTPGDKYKRDKFSDTSQTLDLRTTNQNIALPGGRHRLMFKTFNLQLFQKRIEMDSCTVTALATDSLKSNFKIFFKKLMLVGVDFDAMYRRNLIRADSVYCEDPLFDININHSDAVTKKKERPDPGKILRELTGDLELAFIGVKDAGIHINVSGSKQRSLFNSNKDNFEIRGMRINADSSEPVVIKRFDMLVRDYHLYNGDSSAAYTFDSIHFNNNKIALNNFTVSTTSGVDKIRDLRDFKIPYFELTQLDWYDLIFEQNLRAQEAYLYNPVINYVKRTPFRTGKKTNLFAVLQNLDSLMTINKINIVNGNVNMKLGPATSLNLQNVNIGLYSNKLLRSTNNLGLRNAFELLSFTNGTFKTQDITAQLQHARYTGRNLINADQLTVTSTSNKIKALVNNVRIDNMQLNDETKAIEVDGLQWKNASITLRSSPGIKNMGGGTGNMNLNNISGGNTQLNFTNGKTNISTFVQSLKVVSLYKNGTAPLQMEGLLVSGNDLLMNNGHLQVKAASYQLASDIPSYLLQMEVERLQPQDSLHITVPRITFKADINSILANNIHLASVQATAPVINLNKWMDQEVPKAAASTNAIRIDQLTATEPVVKVATHQNDSLTVINIPKSDGSSVKASGLVINKDGLKLGSLSLNTTAATLLKANGEKFGVEKGKVDVKLSNLHIAEKGGKTNWRAVVDHLSLQNPNSIAIGKNKNKLHFEKVAVGNFNLSSDYVADVDQLIKANISAWLHSATGQYTDNKTTLKWYNAEYNYSNKTLSLDSFNYHPTQSRDSVIAHTPYQIDYITFKSGAIKLTGFNLKRYKKDSTLIANSLNVSNPVITVYRDKQPPIMSGVIKPLPVDMIKRISMPVSLRRVNLFDAMLSYTERNARTRMEGTLDLTHINGRLETIKNFNLKENDSLSLILNGYLIDSAQLNLRIKESYADSLSGFLMTLRMKPTTLSFLNPVLAPLSNFKIVSGTIDSFNLRAVGRENFSIGKMNMHYHNLRIQLVKDGNPDKSTVFRNVISFLANTFFIKRNNDDRTGLVYFERLRNRSFFNYIVKMTFSGMATSIGVKKNSKYIRKYKKELEDQNLPPIEFE